MTTKDMDISVSMKDTPYGLSDWVHDSVNQIVFESEVIHEIINKLEENGLKVSDVKKCKTQIQPHPFISVYIDPDFLIYFKYIGTTYDRILRADMLMRYSGKDHPPLLLYHIDFRCKFKEPLVIVGDHRYGFADGNFSHISAMPDESGSAANHIISVINDTIRNYPEYTITEINM